ncbi:cell wall-binding repeat-containing protein [Guptibacillus algicola]|uniref:cell wall-binding repeat-containing protein n=1 Tax=Guptibacillus algicola TaxID=225844 RepID=UPI001CD7CCD1|nr:cell wall-binding repeat-containing protein [Alkalihalobacillus algicola]MCA0987490.1 cell wall-binding repeat-containing protein [Alkalihalobacillus algicola]
MKRVVSVLLILLLAFSAFYSNTESVNAASGSERLKGKDRYATAIEIAKEGWPNGLDSNEKAVVLARADDPADALAAASLAGVKDAPILLTSTSRVPSSVMQEIARLGTEKVYALGGTAAISNSVVSQLSGQGYEVERVSGKNRFSTAAAINEEAGTASNTEAILVNGITVADALSASSYSAINEVPIYLSTKTRIPSELPNSVKEVKIFGGSAVVGSDLESSLKNKGIDVTRLSGKDRFGTNINANKELKASSEDFILVRGYSSSKTKEDYPDAVAASGLANRMDMNIVLTHPTKVLNDVKQFVSNQNGQAYVLGGSGAISQQVVNGLLAKGLFKAHFIYVDQGGSTLLQTPNGKNILIDGGRRGAGEKVLCYLEDHGVE